MSFLQTSKRATNYLVESRGRGSMSEKRLLKGADGIAGSSAQRRIA